MTKKRPLSPRENRMWQRVAKSVRQIEPDRTIRPKEPDPEPPQEPNVSRENIGPEKPYERPRASASDFDRLMNSTRMPGEKSPSRSAAGSKPQTVPGLADRSREKRVRRGKFELGPVLDLHGHTQDSAKSALANFVRFHRSQNETSLLVITGKGRAGGGILRKRFLEWIAEPAFKTHVGGYSQAHQKHGGDGAFYLFLRKPKTKA